MVPIYAPVEHLAPAFACLGFRWCKLSRRAAKLEEVELLVHYIDEIT
jgi:hypothetical protein